MMTKDEFQVLCRAARSLTGDYAKGYNRGVRRLYYGESFIMAGEHQAWLAMDSEMGQGYRDGLTGEEPEQESPQPEQAEALTPARRDALKNEIATQLEEALRTDAELRRDAIFFGRIGLEDMTDAQLVLSAECWLEDHAS